MTDYATQPETNPIRRAKLKPNSRARAITAMCAHCMGCTEERVEPGWRRDVRECAATKCPLHSFRPGRTEDD